MGKIFYLMGKSASGKDTLYKRLLEVCPKLKTIILYTTRPMRDGETDGVEYYFTTPEVLQRFSEEGKMIELRTYETVSGPWSYATVDDGQVDLENEDYLAIGTLISYENMRNYYGEDHVIPLYIAVDDGVRLERALRRERQQKNQIMRSCAGDFWQMKRTFPGRIYSGWELKKPMKTRILRSVSSS